MAKGYVAVFGPSPPGTLGGGELLYFTGRGCPSPRRVDHKAKARNRRRSELAKESRSRNRG